MPTRATIHFFGSNNPDNTGGFWHRRHPLPLDPATTKPATLLVSVRAAAAEQGIAAPTAPRLVALLWTQRDGDVRLRGGAPSQAQAPSFENAFVFQNHQVPVPIQIPVQIPLQVQVQRPQVVQPVAIPQVLQRQAWLLRAGTNYYQQYNIPHAPPTPAAALPVQLQQTIGCRLGLRHVPSTVLANAATTMHVNVPHVLQAPVQIPVPVQVSRPRPPQAQPQMLPPEPAGLEVTGLVNNVGLLDVADDVWRGYIGVGAAADHEEEEGEGDQQQLRLHIIVDVDGRYAGERPGGRRARGRCGGGYASGDGRNRGNAGQPGGDADDDDERNRDGGDARNAAGGDG